VFETAIRFHAGIQCVLTGVSERRMAQIVRQADCLNKLLIQLQLAGNCPADLCHFQRMSQACPIVISFVINKYLRLVNQAPKSRGMYNAVPVALKLAAVGVARLRVAAPPAGAFLPSVRRQITAGVD
jgi:hypothetical protein